MLQPVKVILEDLPKGLAYNSFGVAQKWLEWWISSKDNKIRFSFRLVRHNGGWYCGTQAMCPLWGYGMPISDCDKRFDNYEGAVMWAFEIARNHFSRNDKEFDWFEKNVSPAVTKWRGNPTLDNFTIGGYSDYA